MGGRLLIGVASLTSDQTYAARMQIRLYPGAPDSPLLSLVGSGDSRVETVSGNTLAVLIAASDLRSLPPTNQPGCPAQLWYDVLVDSPGIGEGVSHYGTILLSDGVTRNEDNPS